jgi:hypothetical protein
MAEKNDSQSIERERERVRYNNIILKMTLQPIAAVATGAGTAEVTNATLHDKIKVLQADNKHLSKDVKTIKEDIKTLLHIAGRDEGASGGAAGPSLWRAFGTVEDQDTAAIGTAATAAGAAAAAACIDETVLSKVDKQPNKKDKPNKKKKKKRGVQKKEKIDEATVVIRN